jgi:putative peptidoglycan lipid II flippase
LHEVPESDFRLVGGARIAYLGLALVRETSSKTGEPGSRASWVALGILCSRLFGLVREAVASATIGVGGLGDVFATAFRLPNLLQNLLGEQTLSASFIPIYSRMLGEGREEEAGRFAGAILGLLVAAAATLSLLGVLMAEPLVAVFTPGYLKDAASVAVGVASVDRYPLAVTAVRIVFPMAGILVLSAWSLGILNSHRRFFLPYFAPVVWNGSIITALVMASGLWLAEGSGSIDAGRVVIWACIGAFIGGVLQFLVQIPLVLRLCRGFRLSFSARVTGVRSALRAFVPLLSARGAAQVSAYFDQFLASLLVAGAVGALRWGGILYILPISLFGLSVAAVELPEMSRSHASSDGAQIVARMRSALRQIAFLVVPTSVGYLAFGFLIVGLVYRRGRFGIEDNWLTYLVLAGYALGLAATSWSRLLSNVFYSQGETRKPARIAILRVALSAALGSFLMFALDRFPVAVVAESVSGERLRLGAVGLAAASGLTAWLELILLRRALLKLLPDAELPVRAAVRMVGLATVSVPPAALSWWLFRDFHVGLTAIAVVVCFAAFYLGLAQLLGMSELRPWLAAFGGRKRR